MPLHNSLFLESNPIPVKWALHAMGKMSEGIRLPLTVLSSQHQPVLLKAMQQLGIK
jgi:4-hydroxy-tetrahydrodipicolinate synthase